MALALKDAWRFSHGETDLKRTSSDRNVFFYKRSTDIYNMGLAISLPQEIPFKTTLCTDGILNKFFGNNSMSSFTDALHWAAESIPGNTSEALMSVEKSLDDYKFDSGKKMAILNSFEELFSSGSRTSSAKFINQKIVPIICGSDSIEPDASIQLNSLNLDQPKNNATVIRTVVNQSLCAENPQPVGLGFCANILRTGENGCGQHAIAIVGKRVNKSQTEYLLKNSWGEDWCRKPSANRKLQYEQDCKVWVPEVMLANQGDKISLDWISKKSSEILCGTLTGKPWDTAMFYKVMDENGHKVYVYNSLYPEVDSVLRPKLNTLVCMSGRVRGADFEMDQVLEDSDANKERSTSGIGKLLRLANKPTK
ncbi:hypothetical protein [Bdellovibrio bacteriovorus]|nr:hypothetical protein [Bdellovibrio bacteriovorus]